MAWARELSRGARERERGAGGEEARTRALRLRGQGQGERGDVRCPALGVTNPPRLMLASVPSLKAPRASCPQAERPQALPQSSTVAWSWAPHGPGGRAVCTKAFRGTGERANGTGYRARAVLRSQGAGCGGTDRAQSQGQGQGQGLVDARCLSLVVPLFPRLVSASVLPPLDSECLLPPAARLRTIP